ncbi:hypothetical protein CDL12_01995 [Handroanthus impetiginosus]|uniref:BRI1 kinase inhibitor 1 n=1 Tax=Handroanthus impetiginosus TaxID=429701 RepID=A0A2G9I682_9LAMI|nr:hypothetical protein CDL12_01995 [Handroanthus impetiginosus]
MEKQPQMLIEHHNEAQRNIQQVKQQEQPNPSSSPPSSSSSPSHEFSFTISLHPPSSAATKPPDKTKSPPPFPAIDLSPADEIFFHGHLLPLHLLSHLPTSPRSSTNSLDNFTLPIKDQLPQPNATSTINDDQYKERSLLEGKTRGKSKSFSLFGWKAREKGIKQESQKRKPKFDITQALKRYLKSVKPYLSFGNRNGNPPIHRQPYSFSGNLKLRSKKELRGRKGEYSAPASIRTSPTNSGLLVASGTLTPTTSTDSTMEELQAAIQAAIAHCKKSITAEDKIKVP